jgi:hypothetical protein
VDRVTRLGDCLLLTAFWKWKNNNKFLCHILSSPVKVVYYFWQKWVEIHFGRFFFTNSSGHPASRSKALRTLSQIPLPKHGRQFLMKLFRLFKNELDNHFYKCIFIASVSEKILTLFRVFVISTHWGDWLPEERGKPTLIQKQFFYLCTHYLNVRNAYQVFDAYLLCSSVYKNVHTSNLLHLPVLYVKLMSLCSMYSYFSRFYLTLTDHTT